jgi:hypothetical protein
MNIANSDLFVVKKSGRADNIRGNNSKNISIDLASEEQQEDICNFIFDANPIKAIYFYRPIEKIVYNFGQKIKDAFDGLKFIREYNKNKYYKKYLNYSNVEKLDCARFLLTADCIRKIIEDDIINAFSNNQGDKMEKWVCLDCYKKICEKLNVKEIEIYTVPKIGLMCCLCDSVAEYFIPEIYIDKIQ